MRTESDTPRLIGATIRIDQIPADGRELRLAPDDEERDALAHFLELSALESLEIDLRAHPFKGGIRVLGRLKAAIVQPSVVTFDPVRQEIDEPIDRVFLPGVEKPLAAAADAEIFVDLDGEDLPDRFDGANADLSDLIIETLALAIDPYPRAPGESIRDLGIELDAPEESPFAGLKSLKDKVDKR